METGGAGADLGFDVRLVKVPTADDDCAVVDDDAAAALQRGEDVVLATEPTTAKISDAAAEAMASAIAATVWDWIGTTGVPTLIILGGDTAAAILGDRTLRVLGSADVAVPLSQTEDGLTVVTKGGGTGEEDTLSRLPRHAT